MVTNDDKADGKWKESMDNEEIKVSNSFGG
jgi:hypothetical protein